MPFQKGNKLAKGGRPEKEFRDALIMELKAAGKDGRSLRRVARSLIDAAAEGNVAAIKEFADRIDGKVPQATEHSGEIKGTQTVTIVRLSDLVTDGTIDASELDPEGLSTSSVDGMGRRH